MSFEARRPAPSPTLKTIASITGLAVTTVSRALKDGPDLAQETKARVREVAERIGYRPHRAGVRLKTGRTFVISFILNQSDDMSDYARRLIMGISSALTGTNYHLQVFPQGIGQDPIEPVRYIIETAAADGVILTHTEPQDGRVRLLLERDFPFITFGQTELAEPHPYFDTDNFDFAFRATNAMIARARKRVAILLPPPQFNYASRQRDGYLAAIQQAGVAPFILDGVDLYSPPDVLRDHVVRLARGGQAPDGVICGAEIQALGIMAGLREAGLILGTHADMAVKKTSNLLDLVALPFLPFSEDLTLAGEGLARLLLKRIDGEADMATLQHLQPTRAGTA